MMKLFEYHASQADAHVNAGVAVVALTTDQGRVAISMMPETLERLALQIQIELSRSPPQSRAAGPAGRALGAMRRVGS